ncbi:uncharacterized protein DFL_005159 [Arthrobotrys flagrans]|uniref:Ubiquitin 3 binding protein But2 C-terminal domain-containing protein n=1 Tax=Arthrobotrys flagrans TaxID=97331 RepID=A0A437A710_ARTFL|nr:hypothetical protein DFL_005159 [Arthrobotrys flagrans]
MLRSTILSLSLLSCFAGLGYSLENPARNVVADFEDAPEFGAPVGVNSEILFTDFAVVQNTLKTSGGIAASARLPINANFNPPALEIVYPGSKVAWFQPQQLSFGCQVHIPGLDPEPMICKITFTPYVTVSNPDGTQFLQALAAQEEDSYPGINTSSDGMRKVTFNVANNVTRLVITISDAKKFLANLLSGITGAYCTVVIDDVKYVIAEK